MGTIKQQWCRIETTPPKKTHTQNVMCQLKSVSVSYLNSKYQMLWSFVMQNCVVDEPLTMIKCVDWINFSCRTFILFIYPVAGFCWCFFFLEYVDTLTIKLLAKCIGWSHIKITLLPVIINKRLVPVLIIVNAWHSKPKPNGVLFKPPSKIYSYFRTKSNYIRPINTL